MKDVPFSNDGRKQSRDESVSLLSEFCQAMSFFILMEDTAPCLGCEVVAQTSQPARKNQFLNRPNAIADIVLATLRHGAIDEDLLAGD